MKEQRQRFRRFRRLRQHLKLGARPGWREYLYLGGMAVAFFLFILGELVWLPDPVRLPGGPRWIDVLNLLVYLLAVAPAMWAISAWACVDAVLRSRRKLRGAARSFAVLLLSLAAIAAIVTFRPEPVRLSVTAGLFGAAWLAVFLDLAYTERHLSRRSRLTMSAFGVTVILLGLLFWPTNYMVTYPGLTVDMSRYARAAGGTVKGSIDGVLVFERPAFPADFLYARLFPHYRFERIEELGMPLAEYDQLVRAMKTDADAAGSAIAFQRTGSGLGIVAQGVRITAIEKGSPASGALRAGDIITGLSGTPVLSIVDLTDRMMNVSPGVSLAVTVMRDGREVTLAVRTRADKEQPARAVFGVRIQNVLVPDVAGEVKFRKYLAHEGGPSHGAMLALALIDQLTPGGVTNGLRVAGTGTIGPDGVVGPVGGVEQKAYTVYRSGADVFFVPKGLEDEARLGAPRLKVVPVETLDDILNWLKKGA
ncbi:MAG TPA: PDZ domain-containing protein [Paenibacillus sp.]|uniref:PDZ domain-containing protein n=1 Tax=Paenibacillus sp. TaxID=58172 RepID=UPI002C009ACA|nr:PDZ domain-containing protein [Paenibacillus sp.]HUC92113.1 PDZ domain-containing protein [Paenibacillus sp.]